MMTRSIVTVIAFAIALFHAPVDAGSKTATSLSQNASALAEQARAEAVRAAQRVKEELERQKEQARIERERAAAQARQEREAAKAEAARVREQARQAAAQAKVNKAAKAADNDDDDEPPKASAATSSVPSSTAVAATKKAIAIAKDEDDDEPAPATGGSTSTVRAATTKKDDAASKAKTASKPVVEDEGPPDTVLKIVQGWGWFAVPPKPTPTPSTPDPANATTGTAGSSRPMAAGMTSSTAPRTTSATGGTQSVTSAEAAKTASTAGATATKAAEAGKKPPPAKAPAQDPFAGLKPAEHRPNELLAMNMTPQALATAKANGLVVTSTFAGKGNQTTVSRIVLPPGMAPHAARQLLAQDLPFQAFAPNRIYRHYYAANSSQLQEQSASTSAAGAAPSAAPRLPAPQPSDSQHVLLAPGTVPAGSNGCTTARCYGSATIGWQNHLSSCTSSVRVGVIDTGVDRAHPSLKGARLTERQFTPDGFAAINDGHGTGVVAILAGNPRSGTPGLAPNADYYVANVFGSDARGRPTSDTFSLLKAIEWLDRNDVRIVNVSLSGPHDDLLQKSIEGYSAKGMTFVAAAGNDGPTAKASYPAGYPQVVAVTAIDRDLRSYRYANRGNYIDVAAPGVSVWTAMPNAQEGLMSGTSFAVPYVTAILASVHTGARDRSKEGLLSLLETRDLGPTGRDPIYGRGLLLAPSSCRPGDPHSVAQARAPWVATVTPVSMRAR